MFSQMIKKELLAVVKSPKFTAAFLTYTILILLSVYVGIQEYRSSMESYSTANGLVNQKLQDAASWQGIDMEVYRKPDPMRIFCTGIENDIGRYSPVNDNDEISLKQSIYSDDPLFAVFRHLDFVFIISTVLSLFAIVFSYNAISGEKENGTLKLVFSNPVLRTRYLLAKISGIWLAVIIPLAVPVLIGILVVTLFGIPLTGEHYLQVTILLLMSLLYITFFITAGVFISSITHKSITSFMILLVLWIAFVFIIPRIGIVTAGQVVDVPSMAQLTSIKNAFAREKMNERLDAQSKTWQERSAFMENMSEEEREQYQQDNMDMWHAEDNQKRQMMEAEVSEYWQTLLKQRRNAEEVMRETGFGLSLISPASSYNLAAMDLAATDVRLKSDFVDKLQQYRTSLNNFTNKKQEESGSPGGFMITVNSEGGISVIDGRDKSGLDLSEIPRMEYARIPTMQRIEKILPKAAMLIAYSLICLFFSVYFFRNYDLR